MALRIITVERAARHLAIEHDGVRFDWYGAPAMAIIALVERMASAAPPDEIETLSLQIRASRERS